MLKKEKIISFVNSLSRSQKFYLTSICLFILCLVLLPTGLDQYSKSSLFCFILFCYFGVFSDFLIVYKKIWETLVGKSILLLLFAFGSNIILAFSTQLINEIVGVSPYNLKYSISFVSILLIPVVVSVSSVLLLLLSVFYLYFYAVLVLTPSASGNRNLLSVISPEFSEPYPVITMVFRGLFIITVLGFTYSFFSLNGNKYSSFIESKTSSFIYNFEALEKSRCKTQQGEKIIEVNNREVVVVSKGEHGKYLFSLELCEPRLDYE